jgi:dipeptidase E
MIRLLLISSSRVHGREWLDVCAEEIRDFLGEGLRRAVFVPHALRDCEGYAKKARERLRRPDLLPGLELDSLHEVASAREARDAILGAEALVVGGGNTFRLLAAMHALDLLATIRARVEAGLPYVGWSAGTNLACPTIRTTNDMPIVEPPTLRALGLVPFQINAHYVDADPGSTHMGETREQRLAEFHEENDVPIVALREGAILRREGDSLELRGVAGGKIFRRGEAAQEVALGARLDELFG